MTPNITDPTCRLLVELTLQKRPGHMVYQDFSRSFCPYLVGLTKAGRVVCHAYQFGGFSSQGLVTPERGGGWRFFYLDEIQMLTQFVVGATIPWYPEDFQKSETEYKPPKFIDSIWALTP